MQDTGNVVFSYSLIMRILNRLKLKDTFQVQAAGWGYGNTGLIFLRGLDGKVSGSFIHIGSYRIAWD